MRKNILIIGGLGYIGNVLYEIIRAEGWDVEILDNRLYKDLKPQKQFFNVDIRDKELLESYIQKYDIIINLASIVGDPACLVDTNIVIDINIMGIRNIAEICAKLNKYLIHFSTCSVYGSEPNKIVTENDESFPIDFYGLTKQTQERLILQFCKENCCILRNGTAYGLSPRMRYDLVVNLLIAKAMNEGEIVIFGGQQKRPFVHIRDISRAVVHVIRNELKGIYNINAQNMSLTDLSKIIKKLTDCDVHARKDIVDKRSYVVDNSKLIKKGFKYIFNISDAVKEISSSPTIIEMEKKKYSNLKLAQSLRVLNVLKKKQIQFIDGGLSIDDRGVLTFANEFDFLGVKRFYQVLNFSTSTIRAFHGHLNEAKYFYIAKGSAIVCVIELDDVTTPSKNLEVRRFILTDKNPKILLIPPKCANGFRPLEEDTRIIFFSTSTLEESIDDDYRYPADYWGEEIWEVENR